MPGLPVKLKRGSIDRKYLCTKCGLLLYKPTQTACGHRYCQECVSSVDGGPCRAETCGEDVLLKDVFPDKAIEREVLALRVVCNNADDGCEWEGTVRNYIETHRMACTLAPGSNLANAVVAQGQDLQRGDSTDRSAKPSPAKSTKEAENRNSQTSQLGDNRPRQQDQHPEPEKGSVEEEEPRESTRILLVRLEKGVKYADAKIGQLESKLSTKQPPGAAPSGGNKTLENRIEQERTKVEELRRKIAALGTKVGTLEGILAVLNREIEKCSSQMEAYERQRRQDREIIETLERKVRSLERIIALKNVALAEQDLRIQTLELTSYDGILTWKIADFTRKRHDSITGKTASFYSPCFFTSRTGYKMCARIYLNGDGMGKGTHVSLFFVVMRGHYDGLLRWPFRQKVTFMLLDQNNREHVTDAFRPDPTSSSFQRPTSDMNIASGCPLFVPLSQLESSSHAYVSDDTMFLRVIVDTSDLN